MGGVDSDADGGPAAGCARIYEGMSNVQKQLLREYLEPHMGDASEWRSVVSRRVADVVRRRAACGEPLDAHDVIGEVLPFSRTIIPSEVREGLFRRVSDVLALGGGRG